MIITKKWEKDKEVSNKEDKWCYWKKKFTNLLYIKEM